MNTHAIHTIATPPIETTRWRIDRTRSNVEFQVKALWGMATVTGHFSRYQGTFDLGTQPAIELVIETDSLDTKNKRRDQHLRSSDFFGAERHPYVRFVSESATLAGERLRVRGRLHAAGESMRLALEAKLRRVGDELAVEAITQADHRELGMTWNPLGMIRTPTSLTVTGRLVSDGRSSG
jgi:polyisoprenoid-binding protein YceI